MEPIKTDPVEIACLRCGVPMRQAPVEVKYLGHTFPVLLMRCPKCGQVYLPEAVRNKMREVEETLENK